MHNVSRTFLLVLLVTLAPIIPLPLRAAAPPVYKQTFAYTNASLQVFGFNNDGDALISFRDPSDQFGSSVGVLRGGQLLKISPVSAQSVQNVTGSALSGRRDNGNIFVAGNVYMDNGFRRACVWDLAPDGTYSFTIATNIVLPADSYAPGEQGSGYSAAINKSGVMVGSGSSYLAGVAIRWQPPYNAAERFLLSTVSAFVDLTEDGTMLANGVEFDHSSNQDRYDAAVVSASGSPTEIPYLEYNPNYLSQNYAVAMRGDWVVGHAYLGGHNRAFAWKSGAAAVVNLPNPSFAPNAADTDTYSVNSAGNILGHVQNGFESAYLVYWANQGTSFTPYNFADLVPAEFPSNNTVQQAFINDAGQVAYVLYTGTEYIFRIYAPVTDGIVQLVNAYGTGSEDTGKMDFAVKLARSPQNQGSVTVNFQTADDTATAPADYIATTGSVTWAPGESGEKTISIPVVNNLTYDEGKQFKLRLTTATGAQLDGTTEATAYLADQFQQVVARDQIPNDAGYGVTVLDGATEVVLQFERIGGTDGKLTVTNFQAFDITAHAGVDFQLPANLSLTWAAGEGGVKSVHIPLTTSGTLTSAKSFSLNADVILEGASFNSSTYIGVSILPKQNQTAPVIDPSQVTVNSNKMKFTVTAPAGSVVQLESLAALGAAWGVQTEETVTYGEVTFEITIDPSVAQKFFQLRTKP